MLSTDVPDRVCSMWTLYCPLDDVGLTTAAMFRSDGSEDGMQLDAGAAVLEVSALKSEGETNKGEDAEGEEYKSQVSAQADREFPKESSAMMANVDATPAVLRLTP